MANSIENPDRLLTCVEAAKYLNISKSSMDRPIQQPTEYQTIDLFFFIQKTVFKSDNAIAVVSVFIWKDSFPEYTTYAFVGDTASSAL